jgi:hypothetical protein
MFTATASAISHFPFAIQKGCGSTPANEKWQMRLFNMRHYLCRRVYNSQNEAPFPIQRRVNGELEAPPLQLSYNSFLAKSSRLSLEVKAGRAGCTFLLTNFLTSCFRLPS